jgi:hypothetical protein
MFYITFHKTTPNVWAYDDKGNLKATQLLAKPQCAPGLDELRCLTFGPNGYLYVANGAKSASQILVYSGSGDSDNAYDFIGVYADSTVSAGVAHPFSVAFDSNNNGYVSSQNTNVVTAVSPPNQGKPCDSTPPPPAYTKGTPLAVASYLQGLDLGTFLPGTFVASCYGALNGVNPAPPNVNRPQGLDIKPPAGPAAHSVRDVLVYNDALYVADEPGNAVKVYSLNTGKMQSQIKDPQLSGPVHLLLKDGSLYITSSDRILVYDLAKDKIDTFLSGLSSPAGMAFDSDNNFFFADRKDKIVYQSAYDSNTKQYGPPTVFIPAYNHNSAPAGLKDNPEFLVYVSN